MKENDEVIYTIEITGIKSQADLDAIAKDLPHHIGAGKMVILPVTKTAPGLIKVPRLFTSWRGDAPEQAWQQSVMEAVKGAASKGAASKGASCAIDVQTWTPAPGYPQGDIDL